MSVITEENKAEFIGQIMDIIEDVLHEKGISFPNNIQLMKEAGCSDEEISSNDVVLYGENYSMFADPIDALIDSWGLLEDNQDSWSLYIDNVKHSSSPSFQKAFDIRNEQIILFLTELYENEQIDKEALRDWSFGSKMDLSCCIYVDEGPGREFKIMKD